MFCSSWLKSRTGCIHGSWSWICWKPRRHAPRSWLWYQMERSHRIYGEELAWTNNNHPSTPRRIKCNFVSYHLFTGLSGYWYETRSTSQANNPSNFEATPQQLAALRTMLRTMNNSDATQPAEGLLPPPNSLQDVDNSCCRFVSYRHTHTCKPFTIVQRSSRFDTSSFPSPTSRSTGPTFRTSSTTYHTVSLS